MTVFSRPEMPTPRLNILNLGYTGLKIVSFFPIAPKRKSPKIIWMVVMSLVLVTPPKKMNTPPSPQLDSSSI